MIGYNKVKMDLKEYGAAEFIDEFIKNRATNDLNLSESYRLGYVKALLELKEEIENE